MDVWVIEETEEIRTIFKEMSYDEISWKNNSE